MQQVQVFDLLRPSGPGVVVLRGEEMMAQSAAILSGLIGWLVLGSLSQLAWIDAYRELRGAADGDNSASP